MAEFYEGNKLLQVGSCCCTLRSTLPNLIQNIYPCPHSTMHGMFDAEAPRINDKRPTLVRSLDRLSCFACFVEWDGHWNHSLE